MFEKLTSNKSAIDAVVKAADSQPGIAHVYRADELAGATRFEGCRSSRGRPQLRGGSQRRSRAVPQAWMDDRPIGTTHGSANPDDQRVPILFYGSGIKPGKYDDAGVARRHCADAGRHLRHHPFPRAGHRPAVRSKLRSRDFTARVLCRRSPNSTGTRRDLRRRRGDGWTAAGRASRR